MSLRRAAPAVAGAAVVAALLVLSLALRPAAAERPQAATVAAVAARPLAAGIGPHVVTLATEIRHGQTVARARRAAHARTIELRRLRRSRTVRAALRRMWLAGALDRRHYEFARAVFWRARETAARLPAARAAQLDAALAMPAALARHRALTSSRLPLVLLTVSRNARYWALRPFPHAGERITFASDPTVFRYEPGQGLQVHMQSTAGKVNGIARDCLYAGARCNRTRTRRALGRLASLASRRGGFLAWESLYRFGSGTPPWISAMTQGTAIQALARGARALHEHRWLQIARSALGAFEQPPPVGVSLRAPGGRSYLMYSFAPQLQILNGFLQAITGLRDFAVIANSARARRLYARGDRAARAMLPRFDTGAWSLYLDGGRETDLGYHRLTAAFLRNLCRRTRGRAYCGAATRLGLYERQPPRVGIARLRGLRPHRLATISFSLSKVSDVRVAVAGARGAQVLRHARFPRGAHTVAWVPPRRGRYRLQIVATGLSGPRAVQVRDLVVHNPHKAKKKKHRRAHAARG